MNNKIIILTDYKNNFGSKWNAKPYRSGLQKELLTQYFKQYSYNATFKAFSNIAINYSDYKNVPVLYTSSEDIEFKYKSYIEDIIYALELGGANVIPNYKFLKANNNKVFMELLKKNVFSDDINNLRTQVCGVFEDIDLKKLIYPLVLKKATGAKGRGVFLAKNEKEFIKIAKQISRSHNYKKDIKDFIRQKRHSGYKKESLYRNKFIIQQFIPGLKSDYKILIFGNRYFIVERIVKKNDFRGSGSNNYIFGSEVNLPLGILKFAKKIFNQAKVPQLSIDIAFDGKQFFLLEFQALFFGTSGIAKSDMFYELNNEKHNAVKKTLSLEKIYADSIVKYLTTQ